MIIRENNDARQMVAICTIRTKMFDSMVRDLTDVRYVPQIKKYYLNWSCGVKVTQSEVGEWYSQDHEGVYDYDKECQRYELVLLEE